MKDRDAFQERDRVIQFPFTADTVAEKTEEEKERLANTRKAQGQRLKDQLDRKREEKMREQEKELEELRELKRSKKEAEDDDDYRDTLKTHGFASEAQLDLQIAAGEAKLKKIKNKIAGIPEVEEVTFFFFFHRVLYPVLTSRSRKRPLFSTSSTSQIASSLPKRSRKSGDRSS